MIEKNEVIKMKKNGIIILDKEEIIETNKIFNSGKLINESLDFLEAKIKAKKLRKDIKESIAAIACIYWNEIIINHPFIDGNKRTSVEVMLNFLHSNNFRIKCEMNSLIYMSLKIANKDIPQEKLIAWVLEKLEARK